MLQKVVLTGLIITTVVAGSASAQIGARKKGDPRVQVLLDKAELKYTVDDDGDFRLLNGLDNDRSQIVFVRSRTVDLGELEIREVFAFGYITDGEMPAHVMRNLLRENAVVKLGAWELGRNKERDAGIFRAKIAADTDVKTLVMAIRAVSTTADDKEKELLGNDDL